MPGNSPHLWHKFSPKPDTYFTHQNCCVNLKSCFVSFFFFDTGYQLLFNLHQVLTKAVATIHRQLFWRQTIAHLCWVSFTYTRQNFSSVGNFIHYRNFKLHLIHWPYNHIKLFGMSCWFYRKYSCFQFWVPISRLVLFFFVFLALIWFLSQLLCVTFKSSLKPLLNFSGDALDKATEYHSLHFNF